MVSRVLRVSHPGGAGVLDVERERGQRGAELADPVAARREQRGRRQGADALLDRSEVTPHFLELCQRPLPSGEGFRLPVEDSCLRPQRREGCELFRHLVQSGRGAGGLLALAPEPLDALGSSLHLMVRHSEIGLERKRDLPEALDLLPLRPHLRQPALDRGESLVRGGLRPSGGVQAIGRAGGLGIEPREVAERRLQRLQPGAQRGPLLLEPLLRRADPLVAEHTGEELGALRCGHRGHHRQFFLPGEVRVEELVARHAEQPGDAVRHRGQAVRDGRGVAILIELGAVERAHDPIVMGAEPELHLDFDLGARRSPAAADRVTAAPGGWHPVHRPGDRLEDRGLPRPIRPDDTGEAGTQLELGVLVLAEIDEAEAVDPHQPPTTSRSTESISSWPSRTNASRSSSAGNGRRAR